MDYPRRTRSCAARVVETTSVHDALDSALRLGWGLPRLQDRLAPISCIGARVCLLGGRRVPRQPAPPLQVSLRQAARVRLLATDTSYFYRVGCVALAGCLGSRALGRGLPNLFCTLEVGLKACCPASGEHDLNRGEDVLG